MENEQLYSIEKSHLSWRGSWENSARMGYDACGNEAPQVYLKSTPNSVYNIPLQSHFELSK